MTKKSLIFLFVFLGFSLGLSFTKLGFGNDAHQRNDKIASIEEGKVYRALGSYHALNVNNKAGLPSIHPDLTKDYVDGCIVLLLDAIHNETFKNKPIAPCLSKVL